MNKYSKILDHTSPSDMRDTHVKKLAEKKRQEDKIIADKEYIRNVMDNIKSDWKKELDENAPANSTTGILGGRVIQSAGDADLEVVQTGLTGDGGIDYGADGYATTDVTGNSTHTGDGEYTGVTAWEPTDSAPDPTGVGTRFRPLDAFGILQHSSMDLFMKNLPGYKGGVGGEQKDIGRNYVVAGVGPYGHLMNPEYGKFGNIYGDTVDELGKEHPGYNNTDGLHYKGHGAAVIFKMGTHWAPLKPIDTSEYDTIKLRARVGATHIQNPADAVQLYYWAGDKPGFQSLAKDNILPNQTVPHDGWRPIYQKPDGTIDTSVSHIIIPNWQDRPNRLDNDGKLADYSQKIPEWCRGKNTRFIIYGQGNHYNAWAMTSVRFQRRNNITVGTPLDSPEASSFVRVGQGSADTTPEQRKKKIEDMLKASRLYLMKVLGYADFPGMGATLDSIAASPVGFHKIYDTHAATLSPGERREFFKNVSDRTRGIGKWRDKVKDPGSNLYKSRDRDKEKYFYKVTSKDSRGLTKTAVSRTPESVAAWERMKKEQQRKAAKGGSKRSGKYENSSYENQNLLDLKEKASRLFDKPVKKNKLFGHLDVSDLKKTSVVSEDAPANSTGGLYCVKGDRPEENEDIAALRDAAAEAAGVTDFAYGGSTAPDGITRNNLFQGYGMWGPEDTPTMWWKNAGGHWNWMAWIPYNFYTQNPDGTRIDGGGWGVHSATWIGAVGVPGVGGSGAGSVPSEIEAKIKDENGDYITPDTFEAPPPPRPVLKQAGLGDPDYFPGDPQKDKSKEEEEARNEAKNQLGVGDSGMDWLEGQASEDSEEGYSREYEGKDNEDAEEEEDKEEEKKEEPKNSFLDAAVKEGGSNFWQRTWEVVKGIGDTLWDTSKAIANLKPSTLLTDIFNDSNEHETTSVNTATSYNLALMRSMVTTVVTGQNQKIKLTNTAVKDLLKSIDPVEMERNIQIGPPPEISSDNAINPGEGKSDKILKGSWAAQGGVEIHFNPDDGNFTVTAAKMLRDFGDLDKAGDLHDIPNPTTEQLVNMMKDKGLHEPLNNFFKHVADSGFLGSAVNTRQVGNAISSLASFAAGVEKNNPLGDTAFKAYGHTADEAAEVMQKAFPEAIKAIYNFTVEGTAANAVKMREALVNAGLPETEIEKEGEGFGGFVYSQETVAFEDLPRDVQWHVMNKFENVNGDISPHNSGRMGKTYKQAISDHKRGINKHGHITDPELQEEKYKSQGNVLAEGWASPEHVNVDKNERKRWFNQKDIHPEYPRKAPPEMVGGWHPDLKRNDETPILTKQYIKIKEVDLIKNYRMKDKEIKKFMRTINSINSFLTRNPSALIHAQQRYPKSDPHLAALNYKMDMQLAAADEYIDKQFPENQRLYNKLVKATQRSIKLTDPKTFKDKKGKMTSINKLMRVDYVMNEYDVTDREVKKKKIKSNKKSAGRFFKRSKKKTKSDILKDKIAVLDKEMKKTIPDL